MSVVTTGLNTTPTNPDTFGGGWGAFTDGLTNTFNKALELGLNYELYKQAKDNNGQGQAEAVNAVTQDSQANAAPTSVNPTGQNTAPQWIKGVNNGVVLLGGVVAVLLLIKVKS